MTRRASSDQRQPPAYGGMGVGVAGYPGYLASIVVQISLSGVPAACIDFAESAMSTHTWQFAPCSS